LRTFWEISTGFSLYLLLRFAPQKDAAAIRARRRFSLLLKRKNLLLQQQKKPEKISGFLVIFFGFA